MRNEEKLQAQLAAINKKHEELQKHFNRLVDTLHETQILFLMPGFKYESFVTRMFVGDRLEDINERQELILEHLGMKFKLIKCEDHYELKKKEEEK